MISSLSEKSSALKKGSTLRASAAKTTATSTYNDQRRRSVLSVWSGGATRSSLTSGHSVSLRSRARERSRSLPEQERCGIMKDVGNHRGQKATRPLIEKAEQKARPYREKRPYQVSSVRAYMKSTEEERGEYEPEHGLQCSPKESLLTHAGEHRDQNEVPLFSAVHQVRSDFVRDPACNW